MGGFGNISWFENFIKENLVNIMRRGKRRENFVNFKGNFEKERFGKFY